MFGRKFDRKIDGKLLENQVKTVQNTSLKLPPNTRKLQINQSDLGGIWVNPSLVDLL